MSPKQTHVALFSSLGLGHIIPFTELARILATDHGCKVTLMTFALQPNSRQESVLTDIESSRLDIHVVPLPEIPTQNVLGEKHQQKVETRISLHSEKAKPAFERTLRSLDDQVDVFIGDFFCTALMDVASELGIPSYLFFTSGMSIVALMLSLPKLADRHRESFNDPHVTLLIDGLPPIVGQDLPPPLLDRANEAFTWYIYHGRRFAEYKGILVNGFDGLEPRALAALTMGNGDLLPDTVPPIYAVGPIISLKQQEEPACLAWLVMQPERSVLFVSLGSGSAPSKEQITELASGLKESGERFMWVLRPPHSRGATIGADVAVEELLPPGFLEEIKDRGMIVPSWAPQMSVLGHPSVGGFMYHGGWNSTLESVWQGVPTIVLPMAAEQRLNKEIVSREMKSGIGVTVGEDGIVKRGEVLRCVTELMKGEKGHRARNTAKTLMEKSREAVAVGGTSYTALAKAVSIWRRGDDTKCP